VNEFRNFGDGVDKADWLFGSRPFADPPIAMPRSSSIYAPGGAGFSKPHYPPGRRQGILFLPKEIPGGLKIRGVRYRSMWF
jgi:hypothetical protein